MDKQICALCGELARMPMYLGEDEDTALHAGGGRGLESCFKTVKRGLVSLPDGRWWTQRFDVMFNGEIHRTAVGPWTTENTWANGPPTETIQLATERMNPPQQLDDATPEA